MIKDDTPVYAFEIPDMRLSEEFFYALGDLYSRICASSYDNIVFDFAKCTFLSPAFISYLGGLKEYFKHNGKTILFSNTYENVGLNKYFESVGIRKYFDNNFYSDNLSPNSIPFVRIDKLDDESLCEYIDNIINLAPVTLSETGKEQIFQNIYELFDNANEHSEQSYGIYSSGLWLPNKNEFVFSVYDTGIGISQKVINGRPNMTSFQAFTWALQNGNSTSQLKGGVPRGLGLHNLSEFIQLNGGTLHIFSNDIYYKYPNIGTVGILPFSTLGTLICIQIKSDYNHLYLTKGELNG